MANETRPAVRRAERPGTARRAARRHPRAPPEDLAGSSAAAPPSFGAGVSEPAAASGARANARSQGPRGPLPRGRPGRS